MLDLCNASNITRFGAWKKLQALWRFEMDVVVFLMMDIFIALGACDPALILIFCRQLLMDC